jgi:hypothetical protein
MRLKTKNKHGVKKLNSSTRGGETVHHPPLVVDRNVPQTPAHLYRPVNMALPVVKNVTQCADFSLTVLPYVPHLLSLPSKVVAAGQAQQLDVLKDIYVSTNPLVTVAAVSLLLAVAFLIVSELNQNYSQVDRLWSILPVVYNAHYAIWARLNGLAPTTVNTIAVLTCIWGVS